jgi:hypothetical protein
MRHARHYSLEQATAAMDWVAERLARMRDARERLNDEEVREALAEAGPTNGGGDPGRAVLDLRGAAQELDAMHIVLRDLERGLVDFPAIRDDEEIYLCWVESEEDVITHWHDLDAGFAGREPL